MVGRPGGGDGGRVVRGLGGGVESAGLVGARELRLLAGVGEESRGERGGRERGHGPRSSGETLPHRGGSSRRQRGWGVWSGGGGRKTVPTKIGCWGAGKRASAT